MLHLLYYDFFHLPIFLPAAFKYAICIILSFMLRLTVVHIKFKRSELSAIPGPWYAPYTAMHLRYLFAQGTIWKYVEKQHKKYGDVIRLGPRQVWVAEKAALQDILSKTDLPKVSMYAEISRDRRSPGLFGEIRPGPHNRLKKFLGPAFTVSAVDRLDSYFKECVSRLIENYYKHSSTTGDAVIETDLMRDLHCLALDIMGVSAFGKGFGQIDHVFDPSKISTKRDKEWSRIPDAIFRGQVARYRPTVFFKRFLRRCGVALNFDWPKEMTSAISTLIDERKAPEGETSNLGRRYDVLQHMIDEGSKPDTGVRMQNRDVIDQMSEILLAGSETTSGTIACLFLEICRNPDVKRKLMASLPVLTVDDPVIDSKAVRTDPRFAYLEACIKENLRMHPIASEMGRRTLETSYAAAGYIMPPYTVVSASYRYIQLNDAYWPSAKRFWPERWLNEDERDGAPPPDLAAYYPFSAGRHSCIGMNFGYAEIRTVCANILSRFDVSEVGQQEIDYRQFITMQFKTGSWKVKLRPRVEDSRAEYRSKY